MKAWRIEAEKINARRKAGSREATARVQKEQRMALSKIMPNGSNWLLAGLMEHAGFNTPMQPSKLPKLRRPTFLSRLRGILGLSKPA